MDQDSLFDGNGQEKTVGSNVPEFSVTEISQTLKRMVEDNFSYVRIRGELSQVTVAKSGHLYTSLKDDDSVINAICWRGTMSKLPIQPEEGMEVIVTGRITTYPGRSNYQVIIEGMELAGQGALLKLLEDRRKKLAAEGLFDADKKKAIPYLPEVIGVITSPTGAVIRDILHRIEDRFPRRVLLWPVMVQGTGAAETIADAIRGFDQLPEKGDVPRPDVLIVARGGGSFEDLMPFQEECVVRAVADCSIPVISAVGHETDTTMIDYVSDLRAPTPTGAAEKAVPVRRELWVHIQRQHARLTNLLNQKLDHAQTRLISLARGIIHPKKLLEMMAQRLDYATDGLGKSLKTLLDTKKTRLENLTTRIPHPSHKLDLASEKLSGTVKLLESLSFKSVLSRGYAVIRDENNQAITHAKNLPDTFVVEMQDGKTRATKKT